MGIIYAVVLRVRSKKYDLVETTVASTWNDFVSSARNSPCRALTVAGALSRFSIQFHGPVENSDCATDPVQLSLFKSLLFLNESNRSSMSANTVTHLQLAPLRVAAASTGRQGALV